MRRHTEIRLQGRALPLARAVWLTAATLSVGLFLLGVPPYLAELQSVCSRGAELCVQNNLLTPQKMQELGRLGLSGRAYAVYLMALGGLFALVWWSVGVLIFLRRSEDPVALLASLALVTFGSFQGPQESVERAYSSLAPLAHVPALLGFTTIILFLYLFPDGRFAPRWMLLPAVAWISNDVVSLLFPAVYQIQGAGTAGFVLFFVPALCAIGSQVYRYRSMSDPVQRQQIKWVVFGLVVGFGGYLLLVAALGLTFGFDASRSPLLVDLLFQTGVTVVLLAIPIGVGFAILSSRLWNIDVVINRTLVYGVLTVSLAAVYVGCVVSLQYAFRALTGGDSQLAVVVSTLAIAALFGPLRRLVQELIDRRFYRRRYDARKTLEAFSSRLRHETDLEVLSGDLVSVTRETLQPEHASLWLRNSSESFGQRPP